MTARKTKKPKTLACRYCGDVLENAGNQDVLSAWTHNHPAVCPYRQDSMPSLNGVHVGDEWRNMHTGKVSRIEAIRLGGCGTYTDREPVVVLVDDDRPSDWRWVSPTPLWSLVEHAEPITRPGEYPVPWTRSKRWRGRSAQVKWRCPAYRGSKRKSRAYFHAYHYVSGHIIEWERTNVLWQLDPVEEEKRLQQERAIAFVDSIEVVDPSLAETMASVREMLAA